MSGRLSRLFVLVCSASFLVPSALVAPIAKASDPGEGIDAPQQPPPLCCMGFAYDPTPNRVYMYGGLKDTDIPGDLGKSQAATYKWNWTAGGWEGVCTTCAPGARSSTRMAYFGNTVDQIILFGGQYCDGTTCSTQTVGNQTWEFNGTTWAMCCTAPPAARTSQGMAWDQLGQKIVLYGGATGNDTELAPSTSKGDTWTLGTNLAWTQCPTSGACSTNPGTRSSAVMEYDTVTQRVDMFGGHNSFAPVSQQALGDTWWYQNGTPRWEKCTQNMECLPVRTSGCTDPTQNAPPCVRFGHRSAWFDDGVTKEFVIFGGGKPLELNDVWFFTGGTNTNANWEKWALVGGTPPALRCCVGMAYDTFQDKILVYGGGHGATPDAWDDTWSWTPSGGWVCLDDPVEVNCDI